MRPVTTGRAPSSSGSGRSTTPASSRASASETSLEHFLFERQAGHCEYFSTAMVVLLRAAGIQARNVNGFLGGEWTEFGNYLVVTQNEAHSWVEVWFPQYGWVTFDPTPADDGSGTATSSWFWPGRILFDGVQHRWSKWVLDYGSDDQSGLLSRWSGILTGTRDRADAGNAASAEGGMRRYLLPILILAAAVVGWLLLRRRDRTVEASTRLYAKLRRACARAGLEVTPSVTPTELLARVRTERPDAAGPAERIVELYLRARWGGEALNAPELREMRDALSGARAGLRHRTFRPSATGVREAREGVSS
ncbi:MAG: transglutaminase domain-containing protein [Gemmatimonadota bacterium]|nr:transglutaminase domain-containing protein [Gemmatimonadota bacterium]